MQYKCFCCCCPLKRDKVSSLSPAKLEDPGKMSPFSLKFHKVGEYYVPKLGDLG